MKAFPINFGDFTKSRNSSPNTKDQVQTRAVLIWGTRDATRLEEEQEQPAGPPGGRFCVLAVGTAMSSMPAARRRLLNTHVFQNVWAVPHVPSGIPRYALFESGWCTKRDLCQCSVSGKSGTDRKIWSLGPVLLSRAGAHPQHGV